MIAVTDFFRTSNYLEAALWGLIAIGFATAAIRKPTQSGLWLGAAAFAAFGVSDMVETHTGAWWRPWWLLVWKGVCVGVFLILLLRYRRDRRRRVLEMASNER